MEFGSRSLIIATMKPAIVTEYSGFEGRLDSVKLMAAKSAALAAISL